MQELKELRDTPQVPNNSEEPFKWSNKEDGDELCPYCECLHKDHERCYFKQFCMPLSKDDIIDESRKKEAVA